MDHIIGLDNGNGSTEAFTNYHGSKHYSFNQSLITSGEEIKRLADHRSKSKLEVLALDPAFKALNGNTDRMIVEYRGIKYAVGLTGAHVANAKRTDPIGKYRYTDDIYMRVLLQAAIIGLVNDGMPVSDCNNLYLGFGMPPEYYFNEQDYAEIESAVFKMYVDYSFHHLGNSFIVKDIAFTAEGLGAYYDYSFNDSVEHIGYPLEGNTLIVDVGQGTLDDFIIKDYDLYGNVRSDPRYGTKSIFRDTASALNQKNGTSLTASDIELYYYTKYTAKKFNHSDYVRIFDAAKMSFLSTVRGYLSEKYYGREDDFTNMLIVGGVNKIFKSETLKSGISLVKDNQVITAPDVFDNAAGFFKVAYATFNGDEVV